MKRLIQIAALTSVLLSGSAVLAADTSSDASAIRGRWDAVLTRNGTEIPFRLELLHYLFEWNVNVRERS